MTNKNVLHISTECYPPAKAGGMADVVGSLPKYISKEGWKPTVITPRYNLKWFNTHELTSVYSGSFEMEGLPTNFNVYKAEEGSLPFDYYCVDIPGRFDRDSIYLNEFGHGYQDEPERNVSFQRSVLQWLSDPNNKTSFDIIHCHDHQVGFVPFLVKKTAAYENIRNIPCFYTIHNGAYNSRYPWTRLDLFPHVAPNLRQYLEWDGKLDAVATAMRFADHVNTVSPSYLEEMKQQLPSLQFMSQKEPGKFSGTLNGIDEEVWNPKTDELLDKKLVSSVDKFKRENKEEILSELYRVSDVPLVSFIGRFAHQKGGDLLVPSIERILARFGFVNFFILGSGDAYLEKFIQSLRDKFPERVACYMGYNEALAHKVYAASDFIVMPSRFEPCGLNQMFANRYGALAIARKTGGLKDTVIDFETGGLGISFDYDSIDDLTHAIARALQLYKDSKEYKKIRSAAMKVDYSWSKSAAEYCHIYNQLIS